MYIDHLVEVCREIKRVLKPSGSFYLNLGDTYYGSGGKGNQYAKFDKKKGEPLFFKQKSTHRSNWLQPKQLLLIPSRVAIALQEDGWILRNDICLDGQTMLVAKVDGKLWKGTLKDLSELSNKDICLPTSNKGKSIWVKVKRIWKSSERTRFKITLTNGLSVIASPNHRFPIKTSKCRAKKYIKMRVNQVENIRIGEHLLLMTTFPSVSGERDYLDGYSVGFYLAEGNEMVGRRGIQLSCGVKDKIFLEKISKRFSLKIYNYGRNLAIRSYDEKYINLIRQSVKGRTSHDKHLSNRAYSFGTAFLRGVLDGFLDGDGYYDKKNNRWRIRITINEDLITDLILLSRIAGYDIRVEGKDSKTNSVGLSIRKNWKNRHVFRNLYFQQILNIEKIEDGELYDVEVEPIYETYRGKGKPQGRTRQKRLDKWNNLFALGNGILTHNCWYKPNHMPSSVKDRLTNTWEHLFHFVKNRRYYYDLDAIRKPHKISTLERGRYTRNKFGSFIGAKLTKMAYSNTVLIEHNPLGKNPGDVIVPKSWGVDKYGEYHGKALKDYEKAGAQNPSEVKRRIIESFKKNPKGKNPGDVVKHDLAVGRIGNYSYADPLHTKEYNPLGKNPGDVIKVKERIGDAHKGEATANLYLPHITHHPLGQNPGDVISVFQVPHFRLAKHHNRKYSLIENFFDNIVTETQAYWFGFLWGDGYVDNKGIVLALKESDVDHLKRFQEALYSNHVLKYEKEKKSYRLEISSHRLAQSLKKAGFRTVIPPKVPPPLIHHFIRGIFDADGSISHQRKNEFEVSITSGSKELLKWLSDVLTSALNCKKRKILKDNSAWRIRLGGTDLVRGFRDFIYADATVCLPRKYVKFPTDETKWHVPDFWSITTQPFKEAHFAVFPERLVVDPIKSSCPKWICNKCGKPRQRITKISGKYSLNWGIQYKYRDKIGEKVYSNIRETVGWSDCGCGEGFHPGVVLDPFCGSGTVLVVAHKLGRYWIGIDQKPEYCEMARRRLEKVGAFSRRLEEYTC